VLVVGAVNGGGRLEKFLDTQQVYGVLMGIWMTDRRFIVLEKVCHECI
jgi:hypothetical protein